MTDVDRSLRETLNSGASRILNVAEVTHRLEEAARADGQGQPARLLFRHRGLNRAVFIKRPKEGAPPPSSPPLSTAEILEDGQLRTITLDTRPRVEKGDIATVVYLPYDAGDIAGGKAVRPGAHEQPEDLQAPLVGQGGQGGGGGCRFHHSTVAEFHGGGLGP